jgi:predicted nucleotidyltransferase
MECRAAVYERCYGSALPGTSNDVLGAAYLHAIQAERSAMQASVTPRIGQDYTDAAAPSGDRYPSASACRALWATRGSDALDGLLPRPVLDTLMQAEQEGLAPARADALGNALLSFYRLADAAVLSSYAGMGGGLAEHVCRAARRARDVASFWQESLTRRYTDGRLRRAMLYGICAVTDEHLSAPPAYARLLGANANGCRYLAAIRKSCALPLVTKPADLPTDAPSRRQRAVEERLEALYALSLPTPKDAYWLLRRGPYIDKS